jgi:hypothetical protein
MSNNQLQKLAAEINLADLMNEAEPEVQEQEQAQEVEPEAEEKPVKFDKPLSEMTDEEVQAYARTLGWSPENEFRGDKTRWTDARAFAEKSESITPVMRENLRRQAEKLAQNEEKMAKIATNFTKHQQILVKNYEKQLAEMNAKIKDAYGIETPETFNKMLQEKQELETAVQEMKAPVPVNTDPDIARWRSENSWYNQGINSPLMQTVKQIEATIEANNPNISNKDYVVLVDNYLADLAEIKPELFIGTKYFKRRDANNMASPVNNGVSSRANTVSAQKRAMSEKDLSAEDREVFNYLKNSLSEKDRQELLQTYANNY